MEIDAIITYVDGTDPVWIKDYHDHVSEKPLGKRYRDWGFLKYLLRGIATHMPFIRKVYLVVSSDSQVPSWVNRDTVGIVCHRDIIPEQYLPTFNSSMIEMFLHRIAGLSEHFVYFNDDMFPVNDFTEGDFFTDGIPTMGITRHLLSASAFMRLVRRSDTLARKALGMRKGLFYLRPRHVCSPMLKSECDRLYDVVYPEIIASLSPLRAENNYNQYLFLDYMYYGGKLINKPLTRKHFSLAVASMGKITDAITHPDCKIICINDVEMSEQAFHDKQATIVQAFESRYPSNSRFEK